jgi:hypothetical protein
LIEILERELKVVESSLDYCFTREMRGNLTEDWYLNANWKEGGIPVGGVSTGIGFTISWQRGELDRNARNGAYLEDVLQSCLTRLQFLSQSDSYYRESKRAEEHLKMAIALLIERCDPGEASSPGESAPRERCDPGEISSPGESAPRERCDPGEASSPGESAPRGSQGGAEAFYPSAVKEEGATESGE